MPDLLKPLSDGMAVFVTGLQSNEFLSDEQISKIIELAIKPDIKSLDKELGKLGINSPEALAGIKESILTFRADAGEALKALGIVDEGTQAIVLSKIGASLYSLSTSLGKLGLDPEAAGAMIGNITGFAAEADKKLLETGIPILADKATRDRLVAAAMKGPAALEKELNEQMALHPGAFANADLEAIKKILDIQPMIDAIVESVPDLSPEQASVLSGLLGDVFSSIGSALYATDAYTKEGKVTAGQAIVADVRATLDNLQALRVEFDTLSTAMTKATGDELAGMIARMEELRSEIEKGLIYLAELNNDRVAYDLRANELVKAGVLTDEISVQASIRAEIQVRDIEESEITRAYNELQEDARRRLALAGSTEEAQKISLEITANEVQYNADIAALNQNTAQGLSDILTSLATESPEQAAALAQFSKDFDLYGKIAKALAEGGMSEEESRSIFTPEVMKRFFQLDLTDEELENLIDLGRDPKEGWLGDLGAKLQEALVEGLNAQQDNPILPFLKSMIENGNFEALKDVDMTNITGALSDVLKLTDFIKLVEDTGGNVLPGFVKGMAKGEKLPGSFIGRVLGDVIDTARTVLDEHSPSRVFFGIGENVMLGLAQGLKDTAGKVLAPLKAIAGTDMPALGKAMMDGLISGVNDRADSLISAVVGAVDSAISAAMEKLNAFWAEVAAAEARAAAVTPPSTTGGTTNNYNVTVNAGDGASAADQARVFKRTTQGMALIY